MSAPIRVAQIMGRMNGGGVEAVVMNYYRHIDRSSVQFDLVVCEGSRFVPREEVESLGGRVFVVPPYWCVLEFQNALQKLFRENQWAIVHSHILNFAVAEARFLALSWGNGPLSREYFTWREAGSALPSRTSP